MFTIRDAQLRAFRDHQLRRYALATAPALRHSFPDRFEGWTDEEVAAFVHRGVLVARGYGIVLGHDLERYLGWMVRYGADFDRTEEARAVLDDDGLTGAQKVFALSLTLRT
jgi:hypothetical protein